jgi:hypothetical protein
VYVVLLTAVSATFSHCHTRSQPGSFGHRYPLNHDRGHVEPPLTATCGMVGARGTINVPETSVREERSCKAPISLKTLFFFFVSNIHQDCNRFDGLFNVPRSAAC